ncbi:hypothetical protein H696_05153 [Fonticula alba]|uniref:CRAL-TRIO domain-containing protein n=1 Tax=Fonticula alba TaxID=691883 RepID=A0A058Z1R9_FONAL|nr:hypothetical protein H696_05153 [Fonticula alba]KCV68229.1 hypothetical protein H696_05153 [Fonticula alba]|eukprot:XP_009497283.1 hypothetical protein H696_05153 [Fonticula alba]
MTGPAREMLSWADDREAAPLVGPADASSPELVLDRQYREVAAASASAALACVRLGVERSPPAPVLSGPGQSASVPSQRRLPSFLGAASPLSRLAGTKKPAAAAELTSTGDSAPATAVSADPREDYVSSPSIFLLNHSDPVDGLGKGSSLAPALECTFPMNASINRQLVLCRDERYPQVPGELVVHINSLAMDSRCPESMALLAAVGGRDELHHQYPCLGPDAWQGEPVVTFSPQLPALKTLHVLGPTYDARFHYAFEYALHYCYLRCLVAGVEAGARSIVLPISHYVETEFRQSDAAHIVLRTIRRFLERHGDLLDTITLCISDPLDAFYYTHLASVYFPRDPDEELFSQALCPEDVGRLESGEPIRPEHFKQYRLAEKMSGFFGDAYLSGSYIPIRGLPLTPTGCPLTRDFFFDGSRSVRYLEMSGYFSREFVNCTVASFDENRQKELLSLRPVFNYAHVMSNLEKINFTELDAQRFLYDTGYFDPARRRIVSLVGANITFGQITTEKLLAFVVHVLDKLANNPFVIVYFETNCSAENRPSYEFIRTMYRFLPPKYRRNLEFFYVIHPSWWTTFASTLTGTIFAGGISSKVVPLKMGLRELQPLLGVSDPIVWGRIVPKFVALHDFTLHGANNLDRAPYQPSRR